MNFAERRKQVFEKMERQSALILFSGIESHVSADEYAPFEADRNFFYLTGLRREPYDSFDEKDIERGAGAFYLSKKQTRHRSAGTEEK